MSHNIYSSIKYSVYSRTNRVQMGKSRHLIQFYGEYKNEKKKKNMLILNVQLMQYAETRRCIHIYSIILLYYTQLRVRSPFGCQIIITILLNSFAHLYIIKYTYARLPRVTRQHNIYHIILFTRVTNIFLICMCMRVSVQVYKRHYST